MGEEILEVKGLSVAYGGAYALVDVSLNVREGQLVAVIGPNGAGKSTLFKTICGVVPARRGSVRYRGKDLLALPAAMRAHLGIAHVPEGRQVFKAMTVAENLEMGAYPAEARRNWPRMRQRIYDLFPRLAERRKQLAGTLSGGEQQMLAIGRGLACSARLLMLDEPTLGLAPTVAEMILERIANIHQQDGLTILLVEQRATEALELCDNGYVLETGRVVLEGSYETLMHDDKVRRSYLGEGAI